MKYYHVSNYINEDYMLIPGHNNPKELISPFVLAAQSGETVFFSTVLSTRYSDAKIKILSNIEYIGSQKSATEGFIEYVRCAKFPFKKPRYQAAYLFPCLESCTKFLQENSRENASIYETEDIPDNEIQRYNMKFFDRIHKLISDPFFIKDKNFDKALNFAEMYWNGLNHEEHCECLCFRPVKLVKKL